MKKFSILLLTLISFYTVSKAQTAMPFSGQDCNGNPVDLLADLDAGKAVILHFYMSNCGSCPPPAKKIQAMANKINASYPGKVKGYAFPYENVTDCSYSSTWVSSNGLGSLYAPMDSGAAQVAHYGGFGMPTVVVLGGPNHEVLFSTQAFSTGDTTIMRNKILEMLGVTGINELPTAIKSFSVSPSPATDHISLNINMNETADVYAELTDISGKQVMVLLNGKQQGLVERQYNTATLPNGIYFVRLNVNGNQTSQKISIAH
jgi:thiol-disulfide isomerase/thioredoxin